MKQLNLKELNPRWINIEQQVVHQAVLAGNQECKVLYNSTKDIVELEIGGTSLRIAASRFMLIHEMMRKAAAKLVMQTELNVHRM